MSYPHVTSKRTSTREPRGFTLIELLVVIAIIVLLVSILMPALSEAKNLAKDVTCRMNLKNIGHGFIMYIDDNASLHPPGGWPLAWDWNVCNSYDQILLPYTHVELFYCPRDPDKQRNGPTWYSRSYGYNNSFIYYAPDNLASSRPEDEPEGNPIRYWKNSVPAALVKYPASTILMGDRNLACYVGIWQGADLEARPRISEENPNYIESQTQTALRHKGRCSYLFDDSHVESLTPEDTINRPGRSYGMWRLDP